MNTKPYNDAETSQKNKYNMHRIYYSVIYSAYTQDCLGANYSVLFCFAALVEEVVE